MDAGAVSAREPVAAPIALSSDATSVSREERLATALFVVAPVLAVHWDARAGFGAHAALKASFAIAFGIAATSSARRALAVSRVVLVLGAAALLAAFGAFARGATGREVLVALAAPGLLFLAHAIAHDPERRRVALQAAVVGAMLAAGVAALEIFWVELPWSHVRRPESTLVNRNFLAHYLAATLPLLVAPGALAAASLPGSAGRASAFDRAPFVREALRLAGVTLFAFVLLVTRCRAAWLAIGLTAVVAVFVIRRVPFARSTFRTAGAIVCGVCIALLPNRLVFNDGLAAVASRLVEHDQGSGAGRIAQAKVGIVLGGRDVLLGAGLGGWRRSLARAPELLAGMPRDVGMTPSSDLVRAFVEGGLPGALSLAASFVVLAWTFCRARGTAMASAPLATGFVLAIIAVVDAPLFRPETALLFGVALAAVPSRGPAVVVPRKVAFLFGAILIGCVIEVLPP